MAERKLQDWINAYVRFTQHWGMPKVFGEWAAVSCIAGVLERRVYVDNMLGHCFPNMYIMLVGEPAAGKSLHTKQIWKFWQSLAGVGNQGLTLAPQDISPQLLGDSMKEAERTYLDTEQGGKLHKYNSLLISINELSVLLPAQETGMLNVLTDLWDCSNFGRRRRNSELSFDIEHPSLNLLVSTTPYDLNRILPDAAWDSGFCSRTIFVYDGTRNVKPIFDESEDDEYDHGDNPASTSTLTHDLAVMANQTNRGRVRMSVEVRKALNAWVKADMEPAPRHPRLKFYLRRRLQNFIKLMTVVYYSRIGEGMIEHEDFLRAQEMLMNVEKKMPEMFKSMVSGSDVQIVDEAWHMLWQLYNARDKQPIEAHYLNQFLLARTTAINAPHIVKMMVNAGIIRPENVPKKGECYVPRARKMEETL